MLRRSDILLGRLAVDAELVTEEQVQECVADQGGELPVRPLGVHLVERGFLTDEELFTILDIQAEYLSELAALAPAELSEDALPEHGKPRFSADGLVEVRRLTQEAMAEAPAPVRAAFTRTQQRLLNLKKARVYHNLRAAMTGVVEKVLFGLVVAVAAFTIVYIALLVKDRVQNAGPGPEPAPVDLRPPGAGRGGVRASAQAPALATPRPVTARPPRPAARPAQAGGIPAARAAGAPAGTGTELCGVEGLVLGPNQGPLQGFLVSATGFEQEGGANVTDGRGYYRIENLHAGSYLVSLNSVQNQERPGYTAFEDRIVTLKAGELATANFGMESGTRVFGAVLSDGQLVAGALVTLISLAGLSGGGTDLNGLTTKNATSDAAGQFSIQGVLPGPYTLIATHPEDPARIARLNLELPVGLGELRRDVLFTALGIRGKVIDKATGEPLQGVALSARRKGGDPRAGLMETLIATEITSLFSEENGTFQFSSLEPGSYSVIATLEGYACTAVPAVVLPDGGPATVSLGMLQGGGQFEGVVKRANGQAVTSAFLSIQDASGNDLVLRKVGVDGRFESGHLEPGSYQVVLYLDGAPVDQLSVTLERDVVTKQEFVVE
ncbi:MAG: carboxypeptidase regulatory-like domain-containing protein [Planctomycetes bacterium]|nr:carboxypeptidase regulatory-like domain-containing protein [Planctomycetota bacterium]